MLHGHSNGYGDCQTCVPKLACHLHPVISVVTAGLLTSPDTQQAPTAQLQSLQLGTHKAASVAMHPEFYVILADSTLPGAQYPAVLPPPEPTPKGTKLLGSVIGSLLAASLQTTLPLNCRHNRLGILLAWPDFPTGVVDWILQAFVSASTLSAAAELHRMVRERGW